MKTGAASRWPDILANVLSFALAASCTVFAGYMIIRLNGMENPPADMGLNFPPAKKKIIIDDSILVDPVTTGTADALDEPAARPGRPLQPYTSKSPVMGHRLLAVVDGIAFVEITRVTGKEIAALSTGSDLPGAGSILAITRKGSRWELLAGETRLVSERP